MPNWCSTDIIFYGDKDKVEKLYKDWNTAIKVIADGDDGWLGRLLVYNNVGTKDVYCRGFVYSLELDNSILHVMSDDAWEPMFDFYDLVANLYNVEYVLRAEELGNGVYINTDTEGRYFPERYLIDIEIEDDEVCKNDKLIAILRKLGGIRYFESFEPIAQALSPYGVQTEEDMEAFQDFIIDKYPNMYFEFGRFEFS